MGLCQTFSLEKIAFDEFFYNVKKKIKLQIQINSARQPSSPKQPKMVKFTVEQLREIMSNPERVRNISIIAHVDHGKTTLTDSLLARAGMLSENSAGRAP